MSAHTRGRPTADQAVPRAAVDSLLVPVARGAAREDALVLNATFEPLGVVSQRRAVVLVLGGKAVAVTTDERTLHSARTEVAVPVVVRLSRYVRVPYRATVPLTRRAVFARDRGRCGYCGASAASIDHVQPTSRGGLHEWDNVVAACGRCNHIKADKTVAELGWRLRVVPRVPAGIAWRVLGGRSADPRWSPYLDLPLDLEEPDEATA